MNNWYRYDLETRRQWLSEAGFTRDRERIWSHADGRAVGESIVAALTDAAFARFLKIELPPRGEVTEAPSAPSIEGA